MNRSRIGVDEIEWWLAQARAGALNPDDFVQLTSNQMMDQLRPLVTEDDLEWILGDWGNCTQEEHSFRVSVLRKFSGLPRVNKFLKEAWETANKFERNHLFWRILDDPSLELAWHKRLLEFVIDEWDLWKSEGLQFYNDPDKAHGTSNEVRMMNIINRYTGTDFPSSKKWAYLANMVSIDEYPEVSAFFIAHAKSSDSVILSECACEIERELFNPG